MGKCSARALAWAEAAVPRITRPLMPWKIAASRKKLKAMQKFRRKLKHYLDECEAELRRHPGSASCPVAIEIAHGT